MPPVDFSTIRLRDLEQARPDLMQAMHDRVIEQLGKILDQMARAGLNPGNPVHASAAFLRMMLAEGDESKRSALIADRAAVIQRAANRTAQTDGAAGESVQLPSRPVTAPRPGAAPSRMRSLFKTNAQRELAAKAFMSGKIVRDGKIAPLPFVPGLYSAVELMAMGIPTERAVREAAPDPPPQDIRERIDPLGIA